MPQEILTIWLSETLKGGCKCWSDDTMQCSSFLLVTVCAQWASLQGRWSTPSDAGWDVTLHLGDISDSFQELLRRRYQYAQKSQGNPVVGKSDERSPLPEQSESSKDPGTLRLCNLVFLAQRHLRWAVPSAPLTPSLVISNHYSHIPALSVNTK